jgi:hypothetical protein
MKVLLVFRRISYHHRQVLEREKNLILSHQQMSPQFPLLKYFSTQFFKLLQCKQSTKKFGSFLFIFFDEHVHLNREHGGKI